MSLKNAMLIKKRVLSNHSSIKNFKSKGKIVCSIFFLSISTNDFKKVIWELKNNKVVGGEIQVHILKEN